MNRRNFALSWGRKLFFGISWPLSIALGIVYFRSFILPVTTQDWIYVITTSIGHFGILNAIFYFLLYCPVILLFPTYYISRFWSLLLILVLNAFIITDALSFSTFGLHLYSYLSKLLVEEGYHHLFGENGVVILGAGAFLLSILIWIRGELNWRFMQGRFSNPVKNWYLVLIVLCLVTSKSLYSFGSVHKNLAELFPVNLNFSRDEKDASPLKKLFYPKEKIVCEGKQNPNIVLITVKNWSMESLNEEQMPKVFHMLRHGTLYSSVKSVAESVEDSKFSFFYSLPSTYSKSLTNQQPLLFQEMEKRKYEFVPEAFNQWLANRTGEEISTYFMNIALEGAEADEVIQSLILKLQSEELLKNTYIIMTGLQSSSGSVPLVWISPDRKSSEVNHSVTHYDVIPTLMERAWGCKNVFASASTGEPLSKKDRDWYIYTTKNGFKIMDVKGGSVTVENGNVSVEGEARRELVFPALKLLTKFNRPD